MAMQAAPLDALAHLPGPPSKANRGVASLHGGQLFAYAASSAIVVVDAQRLCVATTLAGAHRQAAVTALAWHPGSGPREPRAAAQLRLASGDEDGRVMVWNANTGAVIAALEDPWGSAFGTVAGARRPERPEGGGAGGSAGGGTAGSYRPPVVGLAWATAAPSVLAVLLAPCILLLWDYRTGSIIWRKDFGAAEPFTSLAVDPLDRRRLVLSGARGSFIVLCLVNPAADRIKQQQYQVDLGTAGGTLRCAFSGTHDLLFLLLQREIIVFDLEYGQPAASTPLPGSRAPLDDLLGCYGHAAAGKALTEGGIDMLYCSHRDGSVSLWQRHARLLTYSCLGASRLLPAALKFGAAPSLLALSAGLWHGLEAPAPAGGAPDISSLLIATDGRRHPGVARRLSSSGDLPGSGIAGGRASSSKAGGPEGGSSRPSTDETSGSGAARGSLEARIEAQARQEAADRSVLLMGVGSDGRVWQWQLPLLHGALPDAKPAASSLPVMPKPELLGLLRTLPHRVTSFCACPTPVVLPGTSTAAAISAVALATAAGSIEVATVQQGALLPLHLGLSTSLAAHPTAVHGLRWLGATARLASYSTEKAAQGYKNTLLITDVRNRVSLPFRAGVAADPAPLAGIRASPSGRYLLLLFRGAPSEIWSVGGGAQPHRLRQVDLQFAAVEWLPPLPAGVTSDMGPLAASAAAASAAAISGTAGGGAGGSPYGGHVGGAGGSSGSGDVAGGNPWAASPRAAERAAGGYSFQQDAEEPPEERLAFCLADGRAGVLGVRGRRISDTRPRRPAWQALAAGDFRAVAIGSWGQSVLLGDGEGTLAHWDTVSGKCSVMETGYGRIHRIYTSPPPAEALYPRLPGTAAVQARVAVLFASGLFAAYDLDLAGELWATHTTASAAAARVGRVTDVEWLPLPPPVGGGAVLIASLADGSLSLFDTVHSIDVRPRRVRMQRYRTVLHTPPPAGASSAPWGLLAAGPVAAPPLLLRPWALLLRLLLQRGLPEASFRELATLAASVGVGTAGGATSGTGGGTAFASLAVDAEMALERLEADIWAHLPRSCQAAWEALLAQRGDGGDPAAAAAVADSPTLMQLVESFGGDSDDEDGAVSGGLNVAAVAAQRDQRQAASGASRESFDGSAVRDEAAAAALGLTSRQGSAVSLPSMPSGALPAGGVGRKRADMAGTLKSIRGAMKSQLKSLAAGGRGQQPLVAAVAGISDGYEYAQQRAGFSSLVAVLHAIATARGQPTVLSPSELAAYSRALSRRRVADRMAFAAELLGDGAEATFWRRLPATLEWLAATFGGAQRRASGQPGGSSHGPFSSAGQGTPRVPATASALHGSTSGGSAEGSGTAGGTAGSTTGPGRRLWDECLELRESSERSGWHEQMSRRVFEGSEDLQEKRVLEYVALGDFQTAVGFLLASPPDRSTRYYRDALCTLGMAFACGLQQTALLSSPISGSRSSAGSGAGAGAAAADASGMLTSGSGSMLAGTPAGATSAAAADAVEESAARTLFVQAAKVITANAAAVGDTLLGVPLLCSTGQHADAAALLQDSGMWRYASTLIAHALRGSERAAAMERWAAHVAAAEGRPWAAAGLLVAAGALKSALLLLRQHQLPDAAAALVAACKEADLPLQQHSLQAGELANLFAATPRVGQQAGPGLHAADGRLGTAEQAQAPAQLQRTFTDYERSEVAKEFQLYCCEVLQQL